MHTSRNFDRVADEYELTQLQPLRVALITAGNPDLGQDPAQPLLGVRNRLVPVATLGDASRAVCRFIDEHNVGGGNWAGGQVLDGCGQQIAYVSYNGRVWLPACTAVPRLAVHMH